MSKKILGCSVCILVLVMAVVAGILGIRAEKAENKTKRIKQSIFECRLKSHRAFKLGLGAIILLSLAHVIANLFDGFILIWYKRVPGKRYIFRHLAVASLIFSWIAFAVGFSLLMIATMGNRKHGVSCGISEHRFFYAGGVLCFIHGAFAVVACVSAIAMLHK